MNMKLKTKLTALLSAILLLFSMTACSTNDTALTTQTTQQNISTGGGNQAGTFSPTLTPISDEYYKAVEGSTPSEKITYTHGDHTKEAIVYLPPDYSESEKYNVLYIIGGVSADETAFFGEAGSEATLKNILDNMIKNGDIEPMIAVNPAFYPSDDIRLGDMSLTAMLEDFEEELRDIIIPTVESKYSTYAEEVTPQGIEASRAHRAFSGFSMGGAVAWYTLTQSLDYFYYFAPMAAGSFEDYDNDYEYAVGSALREELDRLGYKNNEFFISCAEGTEDVTYEKMELLMERFREEYPDLFIFTDSDKSQGNITYKIKDGAKHEYANAYEYLYNSLGAFWGKR